MTHQGKIGRDPVAIAALLLSAVASAISILAFAFSVYQYYSAEAQKRTSSATEISKSFLVDADFDSAWRSMRKPSLSEDEQTKITWNFRKLDYYALLINTDQVDSAFITRTLWCVLDVAPHYVDVFYSRSELILGKEEFSDLVKVAPEAKKRCNAS